MECTREWFILNGGSILYMVKNGDTVTAMDIVPSHPTNIEEVDAQMFAKPDDLLWVLSGGFITFVRGWKLASRFVNGVGHAEVTHMRTGSHAVMRGFPNNDVACVAAVRMAAFLDELVHMHDLEAGVKNDEDEDGEEVGEPCQ